jgi:N-acetylglucosamine-6-phosphate deacetylase
MTDFHCSRFLDRDGVLHEASIAARDGRLIEHHVGSPLMGAEQDQPADFVAEGLAVDIHRHTVGHWDFADLPSVDLADVNERARREGILCVPCAFVRRSALDGFVEFMRDYAARRDAFPHVPAISLEGPLLASSGGTPEEGAWRPTEREWEQLARCGEWGLRYCVLSPDALMAHSRLSEAQRRTSPPLEWIVRTLGQGGVLPALGHFAREDPPSSAAAVREAADVARDVGVPLLSDHFLNDMPSQIPYAWRTEERRAERSEELERLAPESWDPESLGAVMGDVPAAMLDAVREGRMLLFVNFDGDHVDSAISTKLAELYDPNVVAMTDRVDIPRFGGDELARGDAPNLWYRPNGVVAAGSSTMDDQIATLQQAGLPISTVWSVVSGAPMRALRLNGRETQARDLTVFVDGKRRYAAHGEDVWRL